MGETHIFPRDKHFTGFARVCVCINACKIGNRHKPSAHLCVSDTRNSSDTDPFWHIILFCCKGSKLNWKINKIHSAEETTLTERSKRFIVLSYPREKVREEEGKQHREKRVRESMTLTGKIYQQQESNIAKGLVWRRQTHPNKSNRDREQKMSESDWLMGSVNRIMAFQIAFSL